MGVINPARSCFRATLSLVYYYPIEAVGSESITPDPATRAVAQTLARLLSEERGGCFYDGEQGECTDGECACTRLCGTWAAELVAAYRRAADDPQLDATDDAHPAWWRGDDHGFRTMCAEVESVLDGAEPKGTCREPWESLRRRLWALARPHRRPAPARDWTAVAGDGRAPLLPVDEGEQQ